MVTAEDGKQAASEALTTVREDLNAVGLSFSYRLKKLKKLVNAKKTEVFKAKVLKRNPSTNEIVEVEELIYSKPLISHDTNLKALDMSFRLDGRYAAERRVLSGEGDDGEITLTVKYDGDGNGNKLRNPSSKPGTSR